jgi:biotin carboxyl carrier protein
MNMRITIEGRTYDVTVEIDEAELPASDARSADSSGSASRVEGLTLQRAPARVNPRNGVGKSRGQSPLSPLASQHLSPSNAASPSLPAAPHAHGAQLQPAGAVVPEPPPKPVPIKPAWHDLGSGDMGEVVSPIAGRIRVMSVALGQKVKPGDALLELEASSTYSSGERPLQGTLRATHSGTIEQIDVTEQQTVQFRQRLLVIRPESSV